MQFSIGHGFDVHAFEAGDHLMLGGIRVPYTQSFKAHSDGDVLIHSICDALLGAAGEGDIGRHFPDTDPAYKGISSLILLENVLALINQKGFSVGNIDATIVAQAPKLSPFIEAMEINLKKVLGAESAVNIKATTTEKLGYTGRKEGIAVHSVALIHK
ncbi:MAG: 2-C-methyl-D-erythritol 2,4-cyclodiphosphate synthase [Thiotrichales bacterium]